MHLGLLPEPLAHVTADELAFDEAVNLLVDYIPCSSAPGRGWRFTGCCRLEAAESALEAAQTTAKEAEADFDAAQVLATSLFGDVPAALREHGSATLDEH